MERTPEMAVGTRWFTRAQIAKAFSLSLPEAAALCDHAVDRLPDGSSKTRTFAGGYGANIIEKKAGSGYTDRLAAAGRLIAACGGVSGRGRG
jgi:hypothetical protein